MRIPKYESRGQLTTDTPGRSISARMSFRGADAIMRQGEATQAGLKAVQDFADMRYEMILETRLNEADVAMRDGFREIARDLLKNKNLNALDGLDGQPSEYETRTSTLADRLRRELGTDRRALAKFDQGFQLASSNTKWSLRDKFDDIIQARHQASIKTNADQIVATLANLGATADNLPFELASIREMLQRAADRQIINPDLVEKVPAKILENVAKQLVSGYSLGDYTKPGLLEELLILNKELQLNQDDVTQEKFRRKLDEINQDVGGLYTAQVLLSLPEGTAADILQKAKERVAKNIRSDEAVKNRQDKEELKKTENILSFLKSRRAAPDQTVSVAELVTLNVDTSLRFNNGALLPDGGFAPTILQKIKQIHSVNNIDFNENAMPTELVKEALGQYLEQNDWFTQNSGNTEKLTQALGVPSAKQFAMEDNIPVLETLTFGIINGTVTQEEIESRISSLTLSTYKRLSDDLAQKNRTELSDFDSDFEDILKIAASAFNFHTEELSGTMAVKSDGAASKRAFNQLEKQLRREIEHIRIVKGEVPSRLEVIHKRDELIQEGKITYIFDLQNDLANNLNSYSAIFGKPRLNTFFQQSDFNTTDVDQAIASFREKLNVDVLAGTDTFGLGAGNIAVLESRIKIFFKRMPQP